MKFEGYKKMPLREVQLMQLEVMKEIHRVCDRNNINYYMIAGSVLGAVRHGGFIPWDDDIDIAMMRDDYNRFKSIFIKEFDQTKYFLQDYNSDVDFKPALMRFCIKNTIRDFECEMHWNYCKNTFLDIFPLDNAPDSEELRIEHAAEIKKCKGLLSRKLYRLFPSNSKLAVFTKKTIAAFLKVYPLHCAQEKLVKIMTKYNTIDTKCVCSMASQYKYQKQCIERVVYGVPTLLHFEDTEFFAPEHPTEYLEHLYGKNYMELPPVEKRDHPEDVYIKENNDDHN